MLYRLRQLAQRRFFKLHARKMRLTPPLARTDSSLVIVSNLRHDDVLMYLVAIKSLYSRLGHGHILIIDDGSLTSDDRDLLDYHLDGPEIRQSSLVDTGSCPDYIAWRGLRSMIEESKSRYVIKMDSDVVVLGDISEIHECSQQNRSFVLNSFDCDDLWTAKQTADHVRSRQSGHVQVEAERALVSLPRGEDLKYTRGCSGFAGFQRDLYDWSNVEKFSEAIAERIGLETWRSWGSEQVTVNFLVANAPNPMILKAPKYTNHRLDIDISGASLIHFLGTHRFRGGRYFTCAKQATDNLVEHSGFAVGSEL